MMNRLVLALFLAMPFGAMAQTPATNNTPAAPAPASNPSTNAAPEKPKPLLEPVSSTTPDNTRYLNAPNLLLRCTADVTAIQGKPCDIIFIGDSITAGWKGPGKDIWAKEYAPRNALDFGIGGDKTQNVLWRLENMDVKKLTPKVAVILIGTNNHANDVNDTAAGVKAVVDKTQATFSGVKIILLSIMPRGGGLDKVLEVDEIIKKYADDKSVYYLDLVPLMPPVPTPLPNGKTDTNFKGLSKDHLHPDASGYAIWRDAMEPLLAKLLAEK